MRRQAALISVAWMAAALLLIVATQNLAQQSLQVRVDRWLEVRQVTNAVTLEHNGIRRSAVVGDRLDTVGDSIITGMKATATLWIDTGVGAIEIEEQSTLRVRALDLAADNGRITRLEVPIGNVHLRVRRFTHKGSELEIQTPVGLSGVRGTVFGVAVQPNGKTGLAVWQGKVNSMAQGQSVSVAKHSQNFTLPGKPPSVPVNLKDDTSLQYDFERIVQHGVRQVRLVGQVDAVNNVAVDGVPQVTDQNGRFKSELRPMPSYLRMQVLVRTPLGKEHTYVLALQ